MNHTTIKMIYRCILTHRCSIEYLGGDKFKIVFYFKSGQKRHVVEYKDGLRHGKSIVWTKDGLKYLEGSYKNGQAHGRVICWYPDGTIESETEYEHGREVVI